MTVQRDPIKNWVLKHDILQRLLRSSSVQTSTIEEALLIWELEVGVLVGRCMARSRVNRTEMKN